MREDVELRRGLEERQADYRLIQINAPKLNSRRRPDVAQRILPNMHPLQIAT